MWLKLRLYLIMALLFAIVYGIVVMAVNLAGIGGLGTFYFYGILASFLLFIQYMIGPRIVEWSMKVRYVNEREAPALHRMASELARNAGIPQNRDRTHTHPECVRLRAMGKRRTSMRN